MTTSLPPYQIQDEGDVPQDAPPADENVVEEEELGIHWPRFGMLIALLAALLFLGGPKILFVALAIGGFLVFHEAGHYLTARWSGMKVTEFFVGFGQRIFSFKRGETTFGLKVWVPFGAYVRIVGMNNLEEVDPIDEARTYRQAPWHKRVLTIVAGPATHFVTAFALLTFVLWQYGPNSVDEDAWAVQNVAADSPLADAGLTDGDRIISINQTSTETWERFLTVLDDVEGQDVDVIYERFERGQVVSRSAEVSVPADPVSFLLGFDVGTPEWDVFDWAVGEVTPLSAAASAGIEPGDRVLSIDGTPTPFFSDVATLIPDIRGQEVEIVVLRDGEEQALQTRIWERLTSEGAAGLNGVYLGEMIVSLEGTPVANYDEFVALAQGRIGETVEVEVVYDSEIHQERVDINSLATENAVSGFLGISAGTAQDEPLGVTSAAVRAPGQIVELIGAIGQGARQTITTENGLRSLFALSPVETDLTNDASVPSQINPADLRPRDTTDANRPISIVGVVRLSNQLETQAILGFLAIMNLFFGLFNLVPLLPLDGGHIALATYERIRSFGRKTAYHADAAKLLPLTYAVVGLFLVVGMIAIVRDIVDPIQL